MFEINFIFLFLSLVLYAMLALVFIVIVIANIFFYICNEDGPVFRNLASALPPYVSIHFEVIFTFDFCLRLSIF